MKKISLIRYSFIFVMLGLMLFPIHTASSQETLTIRYNKEKSIVTLIPSTNDIRFKPKGFTLERPDDLGHGLDGWYWTQNQQNNGRTPSLKVIGSFDSVEASKIEAIHIQTPDTHSVKVVVEYEPEEQKDTSQDVTAVGDNDTNNNNFIFWGVAGIVFVALLVLILFFIRKNNKKKRKSESIEQKGVELGLEVVEVVSTDLEATLDHVYRSPDEYYTIDVTRDFKDTAVRKIYLHHSAIKKMYDFFKGSLESAEKTNETGCYFIGCWEPCKESPSAYNISVEDIVEPGDDIDPGEFSFSFGKKIGVKLDTMISQMSESTNRDYVHTVWMHSHPGLGLFLSSHDLLVQKQLAYTDAPMRMAAFVIDTNTPNWDFAIFTSKTNGTMNNKEDLARIYSLDELYQWSRSVHAKQEQTAPESVALETSDMENYYVVQINHQGTTRTLNLYFSGKTINTMDDILYQYSGQKKLGGYLIGTRDGRGNYLFDDCSSENMDSAIGILVIDAESTPDGVVQSYCGDTIVHCVVVCRDNDEMWILTRETNEKPFSPQTDLFVCSMRPMKEWLRRKRVYK